MSDELNKEIERLKRENEGLKAQVEMYVDEQKTLRDEFAMELLKIMIPECRTESEYDVMPTAIYRMADAMLKAREE